MITAFRPAYLPLSTRTTLPDFRTQWDAIRLKWIQDATRRRLAGFEREELDSLNTEEADNLIDEWLDELNADNPSEQNEQTLSEIEQDELEVDDIADSRLYLAVGFPCDNRFNCFSGCCENGKCVSKKKDWFHVSYCPAECRGSAFGS